MVAKDVIHKAKTVLIIIDMINPLEFPEGEQLLSQSLPVAKQIASLKFRMKKKQIPVIYANDNFGQWRSNWKELFQKCQKKDCLGRPLSQSLKPDKDDYFVLKPKYSSFYCTPLEILLKQIGAKKLIITGIATDICILFSVHDAFIRNFEVIVPEDCTAAESIAQKNQSIAYMKKMFHIKTTESAKIKIS